MSSAQAKIFRTTNPSGWAWTFDRTDVQDSAIDNFATATSAAAALDAIKPLVAAMPGTLSSLLVNISAFE